jgi:hypothetical protein
MITTRATSSDPDADTTVILHGLSPRERNRLQLLALRYRIRRGTTLRPVAIFDLRLRHGRGCRRADIWTAR